MNIFKKLYKYFNKKPPEIVQDNPIMSSLSIGINKDGTINIVCDWPEFNDDNAKTIDPIARFYALTIYSLNEGLLENDIMDTLKKHEVSNPYNTLFVHNTLLELIRLQKLKKNYKSSNHPIISPLEVFKTEK